MGRWTGVKLCPHSGCKFYMEIFESKLSHRHPCASGSGGRVGGWPSYSRDREGAILGKEAPEPGLGGGRTQTGSGTSKFYSVGSTGYSINWGGAVPREKGVEGRYGHISSAVVFSLCTGSLGTILHGTRAPSRLRWSRICLQCRRLGFVPWVGRIPWRKEWLPTPVFLPGESHGQGSLVGYSPRGCRVGHD